LLHDLRCPILLHDLHLSLSAALTSPPGVMRDRLCRGPDDLAV
jgi:hypothetical protein